tara:strand:- start:1710 stop:2510 length:801 start_codon:yes stop_codon:yes gene_type:complete
MRFFNFKKKIRSLDLSRLKDYKLDNKRINIIDIEYKKSAKKYIEESFKIAFKLLKDKFSDKLINGPINKLSFLNRKFLGITEYISNEFNQKKIGMLIYNKKLSVSVVTTHLPLQLVSKKITKNLIEEKIEIIDSFFRKNLNKKPKIAVTGLNPHCESILKFNEDKKIVLPAIKSSIRKKINVKGPFPADTIFLKSNRDKFNVILGMYHDQVLTPLKTLFEYDAINITMGLPFLRISPDHGPNESMLRKNKSNPLSLLKALKFLDRK